MPFAALPPDSLPRAERYRHAASDNTRPMSNKSPVMLTSISFHASLQTCHAEAAAIAATTTKIYAARHARRGGAPRGDERVAPTASSRVRCPSDLASRHLSTDAVTAVA